MFVNMGYEQAPDGALEKKRGGKKGGDWEREWAQWIESNTVNSVNKSMA